jgi:hypothetical protein
MNNNYTSINDLEDNSRPQSHPQSNPQLHPQSNPQSNPQQRPMQNQMEMLKRFLAEGNDSENEENEENETNDSEKSFNWEIVYKILVLILLSFILFYVIKIKRELLGLYE